MLERAKVTLSDTHPAPAMPRPNHEVQGVADEARINLARLQAELDRKVANHCPIARAMLELQGKYGLSNIEFSQHPVSRIIRITRAY